MNKTYSVRFFTRDYIDSEIDKEHEICHLSDNKYIPIPNVGDIICLSDTCPDVYKVKEVAYCYPYSEDEEYEYEIDVVVEADN